MIFNFLYIIVGLLYTLCLELFVLFMMVSFQAIPGRFFVVHQRTIVRILVVCSLLTGLAGGVVCTIAEGYISFGQYFIAIFPALFVPFLIGGLVTEARIPKEEKEEEFIELYMEEGTYTIDSRVDVWNGQLRAINVAYCGDKAVRFVAAVPRRPVTIKAYCKMTEKQNQYLCMKYEEIKDAADEQGSQTSKMKSPKRTRTKEEKKELVHTIILMVAAFAIPLPTTPTFLWYKTYGQGDNPYIGLMIFSLMVVVFGGCRKLFLHGHGFSSKVQRFIFSAFYYLMLVGWIVYRLAMLFPWIFSD